MTLLEQGLGLDDLQICLQPKRFCDSFGLLGYVVDSAPKDLELLNTVGLWQRLLEIIA